MKIMLLPVSNNVKRKCYLFKRLGERHYSLKKKFEGVSFIQCLGECHYSAKKRKKTFDGVSFIKGRITLLIPNVYIDCTLGP